MITTPTISRIQRVPGSGKIKVQFSDQHGMSFKNRAELVRDLQEWAADHRNLRMLALLVAFDRLRDGDERTVANFSLSIDSDRV